MCERDTFGGSTANPLSDDGELRRILVGEPALGPRRERRRAEAEEALALVREPLAQPAGRLLHPAVLGEPPGELLGGLLRLEVGELGLLLGEEVPRLDLEQRGDEHEELAARVEIELVALGEMRDERDDDRGDVDVRRLELILEDERQEEVERALEGVEVQLQLAHGGRHHGDPSLGGSDAAAGRAQRAACAARPSSGPACARRLALPRQPRRLPAPSAPARGAG